LSCVGRSIWPKYVTGFSETAGWTIFPSRGDLLPLVCDELCKLAAARLAAEAAGQSFNSTALVHEVDTALRPWRLLMKGGCATLWRHFRGETRPWCYNPVVAFVSWTGILQASDK
jgi:hypothetical protein